MRQSPSGGRPFDHAPAPRRGRCRCSRGETPAPAKTHRWSDDEARTVRAETVSRTTAPAAKIALPIRGLLDDPAFVGIGRVGRSLGMHLLMASQRLEEGRLRALESHMSYRVALRVFNAMESRTIIGLADAYTAHAGVRLSQDRRR